jgi:hypothetical protein
MRIGPGRGSAEDLFDGRLSVWLCDVIQRCTLRVGGNETGTGIRTHGAYPWTNDD